MDILSRIATHPEYQKMGYGSRALHLLQEYYEGKIVGIREDTEEETIDEVQEEELGLLQENVAPRKNLPPLLLELSERPPERLNYLGTSYGLTANLLRFWKKGGYIPTYVRQTKNDLTGEHTVIMLKVLGGESGNRSLGWLSEFWTDFRHRLVHLLGYQLSALAPSLALSLLHNKAADTSNAALRISPALLTAHVTLYDVKRLELYSNNMADHHLVTDLLPSLAKLVMTRQLGDLHLSAVQLALLVGLGLQHKTVDDLSTELELPASQLLALFNRSIRKISLILKSILEGGIAKDLDLVENTKVAKQGCKLPSLEEELSQGAEEVDQKQKEVFVNQNLSQFSIKGSDEDWNKALVGGKTSGMVSLKTGEKRPGESQEEEVPSQKQKKKKKKGDKANHKKKLKT